MTAPVTFATADEAHDHLAAVRADRMRGVYRDHRDGRNVAFEKFAAEWIANGGSRGRLAPRTEELYRDLLAHQLDHFTGVPVAAITPAEVRSWYSRTRKSLADDARRRAEKSAKRKGLDVVTVTRTGETRLRQAYALLKSIMSTAATDGLVPENPCRIMGAGVADAPERSALEPEQLAAIVDLMPDHYRLPILVAYGAHLRLGEVIGLRRGDYLADRGALRLDEQEYATGRRSGLKQKTGRITTLPPSVACQLAAHLQQRRGFPMDAMFTRPLTPRERSLSAAEGSSLTAVPLTRNALQQAWAKAAKAAGLEGAHFHDVKHSSLTTAAQAGASLRELMDRAGHKTPRAALIYQHASEQRNALIAERLDALSGGLLGGPYGTPVARSEERALPSGSHGQAENQA